MSESSSTPAVVPPAKRLNWRRMGVVWALLAAAMSTVAVFCWAVMPKGDAGADGDGLSAFKTTVWPKGMAPARSWRFIVVHHSASPSGTLKSIDQEHRARGFEHGAGYHFIINNGKAAGTADGQLTPTPRWTDQLEGAHTAVGSHPEFNAEGIGICLIGNFDNEPPTLRQIETLELLIVVLRERYNIPLEFVLGHGELKNTHCPGLLFPMETVLMDLRQAYLTKRLKLSTADEP
jgi:N-acetylmuramoyl-L-alanine amidase